MFFGVFFFTYEIFWWLLLPDILLYVNILFLPAYADDEFSAFSDKELVVRLGRGGEVVELGCSLFFLIFV